MKYICQNRRHSQLLTKEERMNKLLNLETKHMETTLVSHEKTFS